MVKPQNIKHVLFVNVTTKDKKIDLSLTLSIGLIIIGFIAGFINSIAGSGGTIVLPILLWAGLPPLNALATNKFQSVFGTLSSAINYFRNGHIDLQALRPALFFAFIGAILGTCLVQLISTDYLSLIMPYLLIILALYLWFSPTVLDKDLPPKVSKCTFSSAVCGSIGLYGGFFGPGIGSFFAVAFTSFQGFNMRKATAFTKPLVLTVNVTSLVIFLWSGHVVWGVAIAMAIAQVLGARLGSSLVIVHGTALIKPLIILMTLAIAFRMLLVGNS